MIRRAEISRLAYRFGVPERTIQKDYVITCVLRELAPLMNTCGLRFKGGTCLKKCYFPQYRFSEDLDFTLEDGASVEEACASLQRVAARLAEDGIGIDLGDPIVRSEGLTYLARIVGPLGSAGKLKLDVTTHELLLFRPSEKSLLDIYSDAGLRLSIRCYSLDEILLEKMVCLLDPTRIQPRDLYDLVRLFESGAVDIEGAAWRFEEKARFKGLDSANLREMIDRKSARLKHAWESQLSEQIPGGELPGYEDGERQILRVLKRHHLIG